MIIYRVQLSQRAHQFLESSLFNIFANVVEQLFIHFLPEVDTCRPSILTCGKSIRHPWNLLIEGSTSGPTYPTKQMHNNTKKHIIGFIHNMQKPETISTSISSRMNKLIVVYFIIENVQSWKRLNYLLHSTWMNLRVINCAKKIHIQKNMYFIIS